MTNVNLTCVSIREEFASCDYLIAVHKKSVTQPKLMASPPQDKLEHDETDSSPAELMRYIRENELGSDMSIQTPFGVRQVLYADYTASGRALGFIEDYVRSALLPTYGNTHTSTTKTGRQSSDFVAEVSLWCHRAGPEAKGVGLWVMATFGALGMVSHSSQYLLFTE